nr:metallophosphoesterase [Oculatella sp. LEGE 06141]
MKQRVKWRDPLIVQRDIDQTQLKLDDGSDDSPEFSFLVIGDTGSGSSQHQNPQRRVAEQMLPHLDTCRFVLHTGDVIYLVGSSEYYAENFIKPYREFLVGGDRPKQIRYDQMLFKLPTLPVPGNHDYYDLPLLQGFLTGITLPVRRLLKFQLDFDMGWHGSFQGKAYAQAFLDCLYHLRNPDEFTRHLDQHYTAISDTGRCLRYEPGVFTRLPNRYYSFRYGGIDFFALDSNTFNAPQPLPKTREGNRRRRALEQQRDQLEQEKLQLLERSATLNPDEPEDAEHLYDINTKIEQLDEVAIDIQKQLDTHEPPVIDLEQLDWLKQRLTDSWHNSEVRGRVIYFHHPPYVTESTKWHQAQTIMVRHHLRQVFDQVAAAVGSLADDRSIVDLVLNGHAHCLEHLRTLDTGHADSHMDWIVCGGSGYSLRRQRQEGPELTERFTDKTGEYERPVARSQLYIGRSGHGSTKRRPYSFIRIDVQPGTPPKFVVQPFVVERSQHAWNFDQPKPFVI